MCTLSHIQIFIQLLKERVTVNLSMPRTSTLHIIEIMHHWCSSRQGGVELWGGGWGGGGGSLVEGAHSGLAWLLLLGHGHLMC